MSQGAAVHSRSSFRAAPGGFFAGVRSVFSGFKRIAGDPELRRLAVLPILIAIALYLVSFSAAAFFADDVLGWIWSRPDGALLWLWYAVLALAFVVLLFLALLLFLGVASAIAGPFYERMASKILTDQRVPLRSIGWVRALGVEISWALAFALPAVGLALLSWLPLVGAAFAVLAAVLSGLGLASAAYGPSLSATGHGFRDRLAVLRRTFPSLLGIALVMSAAVLVPVIGLVMMPSAVVGSADLLARRGELSG